MKLYEKEPNMKKHMNLSHIPVFVRSGWMNNLKCHAPVCEKVMKTTAAAAAVTTTTTAMLMKAGEANTQETSGQCQANEHTHTSHCAIQISLRRCK